MKQKKKLKFKVSEGLQSYHTIYAELPYQSLASDCDDLVQSIFLYLKLLLPMSTYN